MQVHIRKARIIDPQSAHHEKVTDVLVKDGVIESIGNTVSASKSATVVEAKGLCVSPGWVDVFADYCEPGYEQKATIENGLLTAATGGFTDVLLAPNTKPALSTKGSIQYVLGKAKGNAVNLHPIGTVSQNAEGKELAEMLDMHHHGALGFSDGWRPLQNANLMLKALEYVKAFHGSVLQIPIDESLASGGLMNEGIVSTGLGMAGIPAMAETLMIHRDLELLRYTGSRLHITGVSTAEGVDMIRKAKADGLAVTCSATPYHLALTDVFLTTYDSIYKVSPPLRGEEDRHALVMGLKDGTIDCIATHHRPQEWDAKAKEFEYASDGMAVQENAFNIIWHSLNGDISVERMVELLALIPRDIFGLPVREIKKGAHACLTLFTTHNHDILAKDDMVCTSHNNPFTDKKLTGKVLGIMNNDKIHLNQ